MPALRAIADAFPDTRRILVAPGHLRALVDLIPWPDSPAFDIVSVPALVPLPRSLERPEVAFNVHGPGPQSHAILRRLTPRRLVCFASPPLAPGPAWDLEQNEVARWCALLMHAGIPASPTRTRLWRPEPAELAQGATLLHPGTEARAQRVPLSAWVGIARREAADGRMVLITGRRRQRARAEEVAERAGLPASAAIAGRTDLRQLARIVSGAARVLSTDGGIAPLAAAFGTPSVTLADPMAPHSLGLPRKNRRHRRIDLPAGPGANGSDPSAASSALTEEVLAELGRLPERRFATSSPAPLPIRPLAI